MQMLIVLWFVALARANPDLETWPAQYVSPWKA